MLSLWTGDSILPRFYGRKTLIGVYNWTSPWTLHAAHPVLGWLHAIVGEWIVPLVRAQEGSSDINVMGSLILGLGSGARKHAIRHIAVARRGEALVGRLAPLRVGPPCWWQEQLELQMVSSLPGDKEEFLGRGEETMEGWNWVEGSIMGVDQTQDGGSGRRKPEVILNSPSKASECFWRARCRQMEPTWLPRSQVAVAWQWWRQWLDRRCHKSWYYYIPTSSTCTLPRSMWLPQPTEGMPLPSTSFQRKYIGSLIVWKCFRSPICICSFGTTTHISVKEQKIPMSNTFSS